MFGQLSAFPAFLQQQREFFRGMDMPVPGGRLAQQPQDQESATVKDIDEPGVEDQGPAHGIDRDQSDAQRVMERQGFRHQFPEYHLRHREAYKDDAEGHGGGAFLESEGAAEEVRERRSEGSLAERAQDEAGPSDADLAGRDESIQTVPVFQIVEQAGREFVAFLRQGPHPAHMQAYRRELRRHIQGVGPDKGYYD